MARAPDLHSRSNREAVDITRYFSDQTTELLQRAASQAVEWRQQQVDSEHLLYVLTENEVAQAVFKQFRISPQDIKGYLEHNAPKGGEDGRGQEITVSPRVKSVLEQAFHVSRELGHSYVGPEHLLIGLASVPDSIAGSLLQKYGLTPQALRQQTGKVVGKGVEEGRVETPSTTPSLDQYSRDLTQLARQGKLDPVIGRSQEIETTPRCGSSSGRRRRACRR